MQAVTHGYLEENTEGHQINWHIDLSEPSPPSKLPKSSSKLGIGFSILLHLLVLAVLWLEFEPQLSAPRVDNPDKAIQAHIVFAPKTMPTPAPKVETTVEPQQPAEQAPQRVESTDPVEEAEQPAEPAPIQPQETPQPEPEEMKAESEVAPPPPAVSPSLPVIDPGPIPTDDIPGAVTSQRGLDYSSLGRTRSTLEQIQRQGDQRLFESVQAESRAKRPLTRPAEDRAKSFDQFTGQELMESAKVEVDCKDKGKKALVMIMSAIAGGNTRCYRTPEHQSHIDKRLERFKPQK